MLSVGGMYAGVQNNIYVQALFLFWRTLHHLHRTAEAIKEFEKINAIVGTSEGAALTLNPGFFLTVWYAQTVHWPRGG